MSLTAEFFNLGTTTNVNVIELYDGKIRIEFTPGTCLAAVPSIIVKKNNIEIARTYFKENANNLFEDLSPAAVEITRAEMQHFVWRRHD